ncbi:MAG: hypothetical protein HY709_04315, partial [Candidatus Latescibacteria bacterium]|nr:hypothetical protein [Candidatus Latescibacterota bacterium]
MIQRVHGPTYVVQQTFAEVQIDGDLREWAGVVPILLNDAAHAAEGWRGPESVSAMAYLMWDRSNLYVACDVRDDAVYSPSPECVWEGDCLELAFDPLHDGKGWGFDEDDSHVGIALLEKGPIVCCADAPLGKPSWAVRDDIEAAVVKKVGESGYIYEVRFPWEALGVGGPRMGKEWGFMLSVVDNDGKKGQAGGLRWSRGLQIPREVSAFGHLVFAGAAPSLVEVSQTISKHACGDEETLCIDVAINSPEDRDDLRMYARMLSHSDDVLEEVTQKVELNKGVNLYGVVWE